MKAAAACVCTACRVSKRPSELSPFFDHPEGRRGEGPSVPVAVIPSQHLQFLHLEVAARTALPYKVCECSASYTWNSICYSLACITYQALCSQLYLIEPLDVKIIQVKHYNPEKHYREVRDSKEIKLSWKSTNKHQVQAGLTGNLY